MDVNWYIKVKVPTLRNTNGLRRNIVDTNQFNKIRTRV